MSGTLKRRKKGGRGKRVCPNCGKKFSTRPAMQLHLWSEVIAAETDRPLSEVESALKRYRDEGVFRIDPRGDVVYSPDRMGELGEDIQRVLAEIQEERQDREENGAQRDE